MKIFINHILNKKTFIRFFFTFFSLFLFLTNSIKYVFAENNNLNYNYLVEEVLQNNKELKSIKEMINGKTDKIKLDSSLDPPGIAIEYFSNNDLMGYLSQTFPFWGKLSLKKKIASTDKNIGEIFYENKKLEILSELKMLYFDLYSISEIIRAQDESINIMKRFLYISETQYLTGRTSQANLLTIKIELHDMENMLFENQAEKENIIYKIKTLLNLENISKEWNIDRNEIDGFIKDMTNLQQEINIDKNPELKILKTRLEYLTLNVRLMQKEKKPDLMLTLKADTMDTKSIMLGFNLPFLSKKTNLNVVIMEKEKKENEYMYDNKKIEVSNMIKVIQSLYNSNFKKLKNFEKYILPDSKDEISLYEAGYKTGKNSFIDYLESNKRYIENRLKYFKVISEIGKNISEFELLTGK